LLLSLTNILTNAVKYTEKGEINFSINCINKDEVSSLVSLLNLVNKVSILSCFIPLPVSSIEITKEDTSSLLIQLILKF